MGPFSFGCWKMINSHAVVALKQAGWGGGQGQSADAVQPVETPSNWSNRTRK